MDENKYKQSPLNMEQDKKQFHVITIVINKFIPKAKLKSINGSDLTYLLPNEDKGEFHELLLNLENNRDSLGISNISISITTLEDVFLRYAIKFMLFTVHMNDWKCSAILFPHRSAKFS